MNNLRDSADRSIAAASDDYDILIANMTPCASDLILKGELPSYDSIPYVDLTQPWWSRYNDTLLLCGKQYMPSGIISPLHYQALYIILYNNVRRKTLGWKICTISLSTANGRSTKWLLLWKGQPWTSTATAS